MSSCIIGGNSYGRFKKVTTRRVWGCTELSFKDQWLTDEIPLSAPGTPALTTIAQEIIPAINEAASSGVVASGIDIDVIGTPPFTSVQDFITVFGGAGAIQLNYLVDAGGGNIDVLGGPGFIRSANAEDGPLWSMAWAASLGNAIPAGTARYIGIDYNAGTPIVIIKTTDTWDRHTEFRLGSVVNETGTLHILNNPQRIADAAVAIQHRLYDTRQLERGNRHGGIIAGGTGTRNLTVTQGELYDGLNEYPVGNIDTSGADTFDSYYGSFTKIAAQTQWDNLQYDNAGVLAALTPNKYGVHWLFIEAENDFVLVYGQGNYANLGQAEASTPPLPPLRTQVQGRLIARMIFQQAGATAVFESVWDTQFNTTAVTSHNDLSNVTSDQHHAQSHGASDHSGAIGTHSQLTSVTSDQHHAQNHQARHNNAGADALKLDDLATPDDNTDLNASTARHGLLLKLGGGTTNFLRADGTWNSPGGGSTLFGTQHQVAVSEAVSSTNLTAYQTKVTMTTPTLPSGDYMIQFQCEFTDENADASNWQARLDAVEIGHSHMPDDIFNERYFIGSGFIVQNIAGVHVIDIRYRAWTVTYAARIRRARVRIYRIN